MKLAFAGWHQSPKGDFATVAAISNRQALQAISQTIGCLRSQLMLLLNLARSSLGRLIIGWIFAHMNFAIPVNRLRDTDTLLAFHHPKPSYPIHILLVPKKAIGSLTDLQPEDNIFLAEVFCVTQELVKELNLTASGYRLIVNGGEYQDVPQLHFHLIARNQVIG